MDIDNAAIFLAGSILYSLGFIIILAAIIVINNMLHRYWKPVALFTKDSWYINPPITEIKDAKDLGSTTR